MKVQDSPLKQRWNALRANKPGIRIRDAAAELGVSEAELLATRVGSDVVRLNGPWEDVVRRMSTLGRVMCLTRNEAAVHERKGEYRDIQFLKHGVGQVLGPDIDLRLFMNFWKFGFAVADVVSGQERHSLQFFDQHGDAVQKIYLQPEGSHDAYRAVVDAFTAVDQKEAIVVEPVPEPTAEIADESIDAAEFRSQWLAMKDTHEFFFLLRKFKVSRRQALRLAPEGHATRLKSERAVLCDMLNSASGEKLPIMVFVGSRGCIQIHTGPVNTIRLVNDEWLNVLDPEFNLHLRLPLVTDAWVVRKPTADGIVTSIEVYDDAGESIALFFGKRKPGQPEDENWRRLCAKLEEPA